MPFSYSQLSLYRTCPRQYEFANVKKIPRQISAGESFGSSVHNALAAFGKKEMENGKLKMEKDQLTLFVDDEEPQENSLTVESLIEIWHQSFIVEGYASKEDADSARKRGEQIMRLFYDWWQTTPRDVLAIETGFKWESPDVFTVAGRFDRVEKVHGGVRIIDFKTGATRPQAAVDTDLQLSIYALAAQEAFGLPCTELSLLFLREDGVTEVKTMRSNEQLKAAMEQMDTIVEGIDTEEFEPTPSRAKCSRCPYRGICDSAEV